jgi:hypothetical protein
MKYILIVMAVFLSVMTVPLSVIGAVEYTYFVSVNTGNDSNNGSIDTPFKTLLKAKEQAKTIQSGNVTIYIRQGEYIFNETLNFTAADNAVGKKVVYKNYQNEKVVFSGGRSVSDFLLYQNGIYRTYIGENLNFRQFYVNGKKATRARYPNAGQYNTLSAGFQSNTLSVNTTPIANNFISNETELVVLNEWMNKRLRIASISTGTAVINSEEITALTSPQGASIKANDKYYLENSYNLIDIPNEWYYNKSQGYLYYKPNTNEVLTDCIIPNVETLINCYDVDNLSFSGVSFMYTNWNRPNFHGHIDIQANLLVPAVKVTDTQYRFSFRKDYVSGAVEFSYCDNFVIDNCNFNNLGGSGVRSSMGGNGITMFANVFTNIAGSAIQIGEDYYKTSDKTKFHKNVNINNNYIEKAASEYFGGAGICVLYIDGLTISNNTLKDLPYSGISAGWGWSSSEAVGEARNYNIKNNRIENVMNELKDGGAIYIPNPLYGTNVVEGNYVKGNLQSIIKNPASVGIYHDGCGKNVSDTGNFIENYRLPITFQNISAQIATYINATGNYFYSYDIKDDFAALKLRNINLDNSVIKSDIFSGNVESIINNSGIKSEYSYIIPKDDINIIDDLAIVYAPIGKRVSVRLGVSNNTSANITANFSVSQVAGLTFDPTFSNDLNLTSVSQIEIPIKVENYLQLGTYTLNLVINADSTTISKDIILVCEYDTSKIVTVFDTGYTENGFFLPSALEGYAGTTRYSTTLSSSASFSANINSGYYDVYFENIIHSNSTTNAKIELVHADGVFTTYINQSTGERKFIYLGRFRFEKENNAVLNLIPVAGGILRTSAVVFNNNEDFNLTDYYFDNENLNITTIKNRDIVHSIKLIAVYFNNQNRIIGTDTQNILIDKSKKTQFVYNKSSEIVKIKSMIWSDLNNIKPLINSIVR